MVNLDDIKLPPHNIEAEKGVLSSVLLDNEVMFILDGQHMIPEDFYQKEHGYIYDAYKILWAERKTIDVITLSDTLQKKGNLDVVGGSDYLYELSTFSFTASIAFDYARIVKEKAILRNILKTSQQIIGKVYEEADTITILDEIEKKIFDLTQVQMSDSTKHIKEILTERIETYMEIVDNPSKLEEDKIMTRYSNMDEKTGGFKKGDLLILAARPSMGKTAFALNLMTNIAVQQNKSVVIFSLEMTAEQIVDRILSLISQIPMNKIHRGLLDAQDMVELGNTIEKLSNTNIFIDDKGGSTIPEIKSKLRRLKIEKDNIDFVVIDYLQLMSASHSRFAGNRVQEIAEISRGLKELARELKIPILALSQLSRGVETRIDKKPQLSDLRESGAIEQDADLVVMLYREEYYDQETDRKGATDVLIRKNRNGEVGEIELVFHGPTMKFYEKGS